ncbi:MAG TPA: DUF721 domain-containing protein [Pyrinomonadaceae bacterium]|nr:DUF721 domain-containing protein [Pyrinomonadaceae bacterium]
MIDLTRLLPKLAGTNPAMTEVAAKIAWTRAAGDGLRRHAVPFRLYRKQLIVSVADAIWQKQLRAMSAELLFRINRLLGREVVDFIEFRVDPATVDQTRAQTLSHEQRSPAERGQPIPAELISAAGSIADHDLRQHFLRAAENCITRRDVIESESGNPRY